MKENSIIACYRYEFWGAFSCGGEWELTCNSPLGESILSIIGCSFTKATILILPPHLGGDKGAYLINLFDKFCPSLAVFLRRKEGFFYAKTLGSNLNFLFEFSSFYIAVITIISPKKDFLKILGSNFYLKDVNLLVIYKKPFDLAVKSKGCFDWRSGCDEIRNYFTPLGVK